MKVELTVFKVGTRFNQKEEEIVSRITLWLRPINRFSVDTVIRKVMNESESHCTVH